MSSTEWRQQGLVVLSVPPSMRSTDETYRCNKIHLITFNVTVYISALPEYFWIHPTFIPVNSFPCRVHPLAMAYKWNPHSAPNNIWEVKKRETPYKHYSIKGFCLFHFFHQDCHSWISHSRTKNCLSRCYRWKEREVMPFKKCSLGIAYIRTLWCAC